jgi:hypothetical protein
VITIAAVVRGTVRYPGHPEITGHGGLCGGEDVTAHRSTFRSVGEAMTWARRILDGEIRPRNVEPAEHPVEATDPQWSEAFVELRAPYDVEDLPGPWYTADHLRTWHVYDESRDRHRPEVVRDDGPREAAS